MLLGYSSSKRILTSAIFQITLGFAALHSMIYPITPRPFPEHVDCMMSLGSGKLGALSLSSASRLILAALLHYITTIPARSGLRQKDNTLFLGTLQCRDAKVSSTNKTCRQRMRTIDAHTHSRNIYIYIYEINNKTIMICTTGEHHKNTS